MNELEQILADVKQEGTDPFADLVAEPTESLPVETIEEVPFHKHPRWIEREQELNELKDREEQMAQELAELKAFQEKPYIKNEDTTQIPDWFTELYGENQIAWEKYNQHEQARTEEIESRILARQKEAEVQAVQESQKWDKWVDSEISKLEGEGLTFDRNKLINTMLEYRPTDENNNFDFKAGYKIYEALEGKPDMAKSEARKQLADTTTKATTKGEPAKRDYMTSAELRGRSMNSL